MGFLDFHSSFVKSLSDEKSYRLIRVGNIPVLLISDPSIDTAICCVCIASGSHNDPPNIVGLAHLCEHLLFMGTEKFPGPNEFFAKLDAHGGESNAFTTGEQTCFHFEMPVTDSKIGNEFAFDNILSNFASFFECPLFSKPCITWEIEAVHSEHERNVENISKILYHAMKILASNHPFHRFGTGNKNTLQQKLQKELKKYFRTYYVSENMSVVLKGPQSLNHLQKLASVFGGCGGSQPTRAPRDLSILNDSFQASPVYERLSLGKLLVIKSHHGPQLRLTFPYCTWLQDIDFFALVWCDLIGDESRATLFDILSRDGLISSLYCFTQKLAVGNAVLIVDIVLTEKGRNWVQKVICTVMSYVQDISNLEVETLDRILKERNVIRDMNYYYSDSQVSSSVVCEIAQTLQEDLRTLGVENILRRYPTYIETSDKVLDFVTICKNVLRHENVNVILVQDTKVNFEFTGSALSNKDQYYGFEYDVFNIDQKLFSKIIDNMKIQWVPPLENWFLKDLRRDVVLSENTFDSLESSGRNLVRVSSNLLFSGFSHETETPCKFETKKNRLFKHPHLVDYNENSELWYCPESGREYANKVYISLQFHTDLKPSAFNVIGVELLCALWGNKLKQDIYRSELVGFSWAIFPNLLSIPSISIDVSGLSLGVSSLIQQILGSFSDFCSHVGEIAYNEYKKTRVQLRKELVLLKSSGGIRQVLSASILLLEEYVHDLDSRLSALEEIDLKDISRIAKAFDKMSYLEVLVTGDCSQEEASKFYESIKKTPVPAEILQPSSYLLRPNCQYKITSCNCNPSDRFETVYYYFQMGIKSDFMAVLVAKVIAHYLSLSCSFELRTRRQLGYDVYSGLRLMRDTVGVYICVLSAEHDTMTISREIEEYVAAQEKQARGFSEVQFEEKILQPFIKSLRENAALEDAFAPNLMYSQLPCVSSSNFDMMVSTYREHKSHWEKIICKSYRFMGLGGDEYVDPEVAKKMTREQFVGYFQEYMGFSPKSSSLAICLKRGKDRVKDGNDNHEVEDSNDNHELKVGNDNHQVKVGNEGNDEERLEYKERGDGDHATFYQKIKRNSGIRPHTWSFRSRPKRVSISLSSIKHLSLETNERSPISGKVSLGSAADLHRSCLVVRDVVERKFQEGLESWLEDDKVLDDLIEGVSEKE